MVSVSGATPSHTHRTPFLGECFCLNQANAIALSSDLTLAGKRDRLYINVISGKRSCVSKQHKKTQFLLFSNWRYR